MLLACIQGIRWMAVRMLLLHLVLPLSTVSAQEDVTNTACRLLCEGIDIKDMDQVELDSAVARFEQALQLTSETKPSLLRAELLYRLGSCEAYMGDLALGLRHIREGDSMARLVCPEGCLEEAQAAHELGKYYWFRDHNLRVSRAHLEQSLAKFLEIQHTDTFTMSTTMLYLGYSSRDLGEYSRALELFQQALAIRKRHYPANSQGVMIATTAIAKLHFTYDNYSEARKICEDALRVLHSGPEQDLKYIHFFSNTLGVNLVEVGECDSALQVYTYNLDLMANGQQDRWGYELAEVHLNIAHTHHRIGDIKTATRYFEIALAVASKSPKGAVLIPKIEYEFAVFLEEQREYDAALLHIQRALHQLIARLDATDMASMPSPDEAEAHFELKEPLTGKGEILLSGVRAGHWPVEYLELSLLSFDLAIRSLDAVWLEFDDPGDKLAVNGNGVTLYEQAIAAAYLLWKKGKNPSFLGKMHDYIERSKSQLMLETMRRSRAAYLAGIPEPLVEENQALRARIADLNDRLLDLATNKDSVASINPQLLEARKALADFSNQLEIDYPRYSQLVGQRAPASIEQIQAFFQDPADLFVEYHLTDTVLFTISVHKGKTTLRRQALNASFYDALEVFLQVLSSPNQSVSQVKRYYAAARSLYATLLEPEIAASKGSVQRIRLVPDRQLSAFPFEALLMTDTDSPKSFEGLDYVIQHFQISYASSASLMLDANVLPEQGEPYEVLGLAWSGSAHAEVTQRSQAQHEHFSDIPGTAIEVQQIEDIVRGRYFKGIEATEKVFKELAPDFGLIHLALHGRARNGEPFLAFPAAGEGEDGILHLEELYRLSLKARLTILSACETGKGVMHEGEGVMSMARGFGIAGSPSTVMSLWEVDDEFSTQIMARFYEGLAEGKLIDASLRDAKLYHLEHADAVTASPFYWATYIPVGANAPIALKLKPKRWPFVLAGSSIFSLVVFALFLRRRRKLSA
jgi:CHAT domain-containing protein